MSLIYITGLPAVGKSTIAHELKKRGYESYSGDEEDINNFYDKKTGELAPHDGSEDVHTIEWHDKYAWKTSVQKVKELRNRSRDKNIFLAGITSNHHEFIDLVDTVICLTLDDDTLAHRLKTRTTNDYGKAEHEFKGVMGINKTYHKEYEAKGAILIDASQPVEKVADDILAAVNS